MKNNKFTRNRNQFKRTGRRRVKKTLLFTLFNMALKTVVFVKAYNTGFLK